MIGRPYSAFNTKTIVALIGSILLLILTGFGIFFGLKLVGKSQDLRNQASVASGVVTITGSNARVLESYPPRYIVDLLIDTHGANIDAVQLVGKINGVEKVENLAIMAASSTSDATSSVKELRTVTSQISGNSFATAFTLTDPKIPFSASSGRVFAQLAFTGSPLSNTAVEVSFDHAMSKATLYGTGKDALTPPKAIALNIQRVLPSSSPNPIQKRSCTRASDCPANHICYSPPMPPCPSGMACAQVMPASECWPVNSPIPTPLPTPQPTAIASKDAIPGGCQYVQPQCVTTPCNPVLVCPIAPSPSPTSLPLASTTPGTGGICAYQFTEWSACEGGVQRRSLVTDPQCSAYAYVDGPPPVLVKPCQLTQCSSAADCGAKSTCMADSSGSKTCELLATAVDINADGKVNLLDISMVISRLFKADAIADLTGDGKVDILDYSLMVRTINNLKSGVVSP